MAETIAKRKASLPDSKKKVMDVGIKRTSEERPTLLPKPSDSLHSGAKASVPTLKLPDKAVSQDTSSASAAEIEGLQSPSDRFYDPRECQSPAEHFFEGPAFFGSPPMAAAMPLMGVPNMGCMPPMWAMSPMMPNDADTDLVPVWDLDAAATPMMPNGVVSDAVAPAPGCWDSVTATGDASAIGAGADQMSPQMPTAPQVGGATAVPKAVFIDLSLLRDRHMFPAMSGG